MNGYLVLEYAVIFKYAVAAQNIIHIDISTFLHFSLSLRIDGNQEFGVQFKYDFVKFCEESSAKCGKK
jgi:hypothetical protein